MKQYRGTICLSVTTVTALVSKRDDKGLSQGNIKEDEEEWGNESREEMVTEARLFFYSVCSMWGGIPSLRGSTLALGFVFLQEQKVWPKEKARQRMLPLSTLPPGINLRGAHPQSLLAIFRQSCSRRNTHDSPGIQIKEQRGRTWIERQPLFNQKLQELIQNLIVPKPWRWANS